jgi:transposase-like protein
VRAPDRTPRVHRDEALRQIALAMVQSGMTHRAVSDELGVAHHTIGRWARDAGVSHAEPTHHKLCEWCGMAYTAKRAHSRFCSLKCGAASRYERRRNG